MYLAFQWLNPALFNINYFVISLAFFLSCFCSPQLRNSCVRAFWSLFWWGQLKSIYLAYYEPAWPFWEGKELKFTDILVSWAEKDSVYWKMLQSKHMSAGYNRCWWTDESKQGNRKILVSMIGVDLHMPIGQLLSRLLKSLMNGGKKKMLWE